VALPVEAHGIDGRPVTDAGDDVLQLPLARIMKQDVVGNDRLTL
jgi:hypothetical protein